MLSVSNYYTALGSAPASPSSPASAPAAAQVSLPAIEEEAAVPAQPARRPDEEQLLGEWGGSSQW